MAFVEFAQQHFGIRLDTDHVVAGGVEHDQAVADDELEPIGIVVGNAPRRVLIVTGLLGRGDETVGRSERKLPDAPPPGAFSAPPKLPGLPSGLPGLGGPKLPGLGGLSNFNPFGKKK
jgi:hypothetical protein